MELHKMMEEEMISRCNVIENADVQQEVVKRTKPRITCSNEFETFTFTNPHKKTNEENELKDKKKKSLKEHNISKKTWTRLNKGVKQNPEENTKKKYKENLKKEYHNRVDAFRSSMLAMEGFKEIPLPPKKT